MAADRPIMPGATLGMLGGGQLGRMFTVAARTMGYRVLVLDPDPNSPAGAMADEHVHAGYLDSAALDRLATECAAVSTEFENVPADALARLARHCIVRPAGDAVAPTQNRLREKAFFDRHGLPTGPWASVSSPADLKSALAAVGTPALLKHSTGGYDGKGQAPVDTPDAAAEAFDALGEAESILERRVTLARELSVIVCRAAEVPSRVTRRVRTCTSTASSRRRCCRRRSIRPWRSVPGRSPPRPPRRLAMSACSASNCS